MNSKKIIDKIFTDEKQNQEIISLFKAGEINLAKKKIKKILNEYPDAYIIHNILGAILASENKLDESLKHYKKSIEIKNDYAEAHNNLGIAFQKLYNLNDAILSHKKSIVYKPNFAEAHNNLGSAFHKLGKFEDAINEFKQSIKIKNDYFEAYSNLGNTLSELGRYEEAIDHYQRSISINSKYVEAYNNLGSALTKLRKFEEALKFHKKAVEINPKSAEAHNYLGNTFSEMEKFKDAFASYEKAQQINPEYSEAKLNEGISRLALGQFEIGWKKYEFRFDKNINIRNEIGVVKSMRYEGNKLWDGKYLNGTLLVWSEQGLGDHIFFGSMVSDLKKYAKNIIFEVDKRLVNLFERFYKKINFHNIKVKSTEKKLIHGYEKHIPAGSLGQYLRKSADSFERSPKKYLISSISKEKKFKEKFSKSKNLKIGLSWKTLNKKQGNRNIDLERMTPILSTSNCDFINLQFGNFDKEIQNFRSKHGLSLKIIEKLDNYNDIETLAALIGCLDLIITIQNSTAHLSAALGAPTWIMLPKNARWHWPVNKKKSSWYPTAKLFRQEKNGDWNSVINSIGMDLKKIINSR